MAWKPRLQGGCVRVLIRSLDPREGLLGGGLAGALCFLGAGTRRALLASGALGGFGGGLLLFRGALGVQVEEAVDDGIFEGLHGCALSVVQRAVGRDFEIAPAVGGENGAVHLFVETAKLENTRVDAARVFERVVSLGEALVGLDHKTCASLVEAFADRFQFRNDGSGIGARKWEGFETVRSCVAKIGLHRGRQETRPSFVDTGLENGK